MSVFIFDADGVLFRTFDDAGGFIWSRDILRDLGIGNALLSEIFSGQWHDVVCGRRDTRQHIAAIFEANEVVLSVDKFITYWLEKDRHLNTEVADIVSSLGAARCCLATNQDPLRTRHIAGLVGDRVRAVFSSCDIGYMKPESGFYAHIEKEINHNKDAIFFIDDTKENCDAAANRGWRTHHYRNIDDLKYFVNSA